MIYKKMKYKYNNITEKEYKKRLEQYVMKLSIYKQRWKHIQIDGELTEFMVSNYGVIKNKKTHKIIKQTNSNGYRESTIKYKNKTYTFRVHRLVATYFCKIPKRHQENGLTYKDLVPNHKNGIKHHNAAFNLEWTTIRENTMHAFKSGLCETSQGEKSHLHKITEKEAITICELISEGNNNSEICKYMKENECENVTEKVIQHIRNRECWSYISKDYVFPKLGNVIPYSTSDKTIHGICKVLELHKYSDKEIGKMFGVSREFVKDIRIGRRRKNISSLYNIDKTPVDNIPKENIIKCCEMIADKNNAYSQRLIAEKCGISQWLVSEIYNKHKYTDISKDYDF